MIKGRPLPPPTEPVSRLIGRRRICRGGGSQTNQPTPSARVAPLAVAIGRRFTTERFIKDRRPAARGSVIATSSNLHTSPHTRAVTAPTPLSSHTASSLIANDRPTTTHPSRSVEREHNIHTPSSAPSKSTHLVPCGAGASFFLSSFGFSSECCSLRPFVALACHRPSTRLFSFFKPLTWFRCLTLSFPLHRSSQPTSRHNQKFARVHADA